MIMSVSLSEERIFQFDLLKGNEELFCSNIKKKNEFIVLSTSLNSLVPLFRSFSEQMI